MGGAARSLVPITVHSPLPHASTTPRTAGAKSWAVEASAIPRMSSTRRETFSLTSRGRAPGRRSWVNSERTSAHVAIGPLIVEDRPGRGQAGPARRARAPRRLHEPGAGRPAPPPPPPGGPRAGRGGGRPGGGGGGGSGDPAAISDPFEAGLIDALNGQGIFPLDVAVSTSRTLDRDQAPARGRSLRAG